MSAISNRTSRPLPREVVDGRLRELDGDVHDHHLRSGLREPVDDAEAEAAGAAGDDGGLARQVQHLRHRHGVLRAGDLHPADVGAPDVDPEQALVHRVEGVELIHVGLLWRGRPRRRMGKQARAAVRAASRACHCLVGAMPTASRAG